MFKKILTINKSLIVFSAILIFILTASISLAVDDNINLSVCEEETANCDGNSTTCVSSGFDWATDGYPDGNENCCGDDSSEIYVTEDSRGYPVSFCCSDSQPFVKYSSCTSAEMLFSTFGNLNVSNNYYDNVNDRYIIEWSWGGKVGEDGNADYGFLIYDEDGDEITPCDGVYVLEDTAWSQFADFSACPDNQPLGSPGRIEFGPEEEHCLTVVPVFWANGIQAGSSLAQTVCATTVAEPSVTDTTFINAQNVCSDNRVILVWDDVDSDYNYNIYRSNSNNFSSASLVYTGRGTRTNDSTGNSFEHRYVYQTLPNSCTKYYFWVTSINGGKESDNPDMIETFSLDPDYVANVNINVLDEHNVTISWDRNCPLLEDPVTYRWELHGWDDRIGGVNPLDPLDYSGDYHVYNYDGDSVTFNDLYPDPQHGDDQNIYGFYIEPRGCWPNGGSCNNLACCNDNLWYSCLSSNFLFDTTDMSAPGVPQNLRHTTNTVSSVAFTWEAPSSGTVSYYAIYDADGNHLDNVASGTSYRWDDLTFANKQHGIKVKAVNSYGESAFTSLVRAYTSIERPTDVVCSNISQTGLTVSASGVISPPDPDNSYRTKINFAQGGSYAGWQEGVSKSYSGLSCGTAYDFKVKTRNGDADEEAEFGTVSCSTMACSAGPDLIVQSINSLNSICAGETLNVTATIYNMGDQPADNSQKRFKVKSYINSNQVDDSYVSTPLAAGESEDISFSWSSAGLPVGDYSLQINADDEADSSYNIDEANENNNSKQKTIEIKNCSGTGGNTPPAPFELLTPVNGQTGVSLNPTLSWEESIDVDGDSVSYEVYGCSGDGCVPVLLTRQSATSYNWTGLSYNTYYRWQVLATDGIDVTAAANGPAAFTTLNESTGGGDLTADFSYCKLSDNIIQFFDQSTAENEIVSWDWDWHDGETCSTSGGCNESGYYGTNQNPVHAMQGSESYAPFSSDDWTNYVNLDSENDIENPVVGDGGSVVGDPDFETTTYGSGVDFDENGEAVIISTNNMDLYSGALQFFYTPSYNSSDSGTHYLLRADGSTGDSFELMHYNNGNLYLKFYDNDAGNQCSINSSNFSWEANETVKVTVKWWNSGWQQSSVGLYINDNLVSNRTCSALGNEIGAVITLDQGLVLGAWYNYTNPAMGVVDEFMMFDEPNFTLNGGTTTIADPRATLVVTDGLANSASYDQTIDLDSVPDCGYQLTNLQAYNCRAVGITWNDPTYWTPDSYHIYRSSGTGCDSNPAGCNWNLIVEHDATLGTLYDDDTVNANTTYYYYLSTDPLALNNSTGSCDGGYTVSGDRCPMSVYVPICPLATTQLSTLHSCGTITVRWAVVDGAKSYELQKSSGSEGSYTTFLTVNQEEFDSYCNDSYCVYDDNEVVPVNTVNPADEAKYWYRVRVQAADDSWSDWSEPVSDYSYCYRAPSWQER